MSPYLDFMFAFIVPLDRLMPCALRSVLLSNASPKSFTHVRSKDNAIAVSQTCSMPKC